jgi:hypothetical protein
MRLPHRCYTTSLSRNRPRPERSSPGLLPPVGRRCTEVAGAPQKTVDLIGIVPVMALAQRWRQNPLHTARVGNVTVW